MNFTKTEKIVAIIIISCVILGLLFYLTRNSKRTEENPANLTQATTTKTGINVVTEGNGDYKIEQVPINDNKEAPQPIPDLDRPIIVSSGVIVSPEAKVLADEKVKSVQKMLKGNPSYFDAWLDLGMYQKMGGDYKGAAISWQYAGKLFPSAYTPSGNLGNLYAYFLNDNAKAEMYYKEAISKGPTQAYLYTQLAEVYRDIFYDKVKALGLINQGLSKLPNDPNLLRMKASLQ